MVKDGGQQKSNERGEGQGEAKIKDAISHRCSRERSEEKQNRKIRTETENKRK